MYFAGEQLNDTDIVLRRVAVTERPRVVIDAVKGATDDIPLFQFDISIARS